MKRTRGTTKKYVESSESEDEQLLKKTPRSEQEKDVHNQSSSSESDIEHYLHKPEKLDLDSEFFNTKTVTEFEKVEETIFAGITRLSDSESESEKETEKEKDLSSEDHGTKSTILETINSSSRLTFTQLQDYTKKIEEAKKHVEIYKAKKQAQENKTDILHLLASGEKKTSLEQLINPADLHSSDFESCDSEREDWEEIKHKASQEKPDENLVPAKSLQIVVDMPDNVKKKKGVDLLTAMKRRLNRIRKENQVLVHKVHLLCWIAHGNYINSIINNTEIMASALSLLPSEKCFPADRIDLSYLEQITVWYNKTITNIEKAVPKKINLDKCLKQQISKKQVYNKKMLALIFVAILRSLGVQARIVMSLQVEPLRPPFNELHSLSANDIKDKKGAANLSHHKDEPTSSGKSNTESKKTMKSQTHPKVVIHPASPENSVKGLNKKKKTTAKGDSIQNISRLKKSTSNLVDNKDPDIPKEQTKAKSGENLNLGMNTAGTSAKTINSKKNTDKLKPTKRSKSTEDIGQKPRKTSNIEPDSDEGILKAKAKGRGKSSENIDARASSSKNPKNLTEVPGDQTKLKLENPKSRIRTKSTESIDSISSADSSKQRRKKGNQSDNNCVDQNKLTPVKSKTKKRVHSTGTVDLISNDKRQTRSSKGKQSNKTNPHVASPKPRKRAGSTASKSSAEHVSNKTKTSKCLLPQVDGNYDTDSDIETYILQIDGANDKGKSKAKPKPNLKALKTPSANKSVKKATKPNLKVLTKTPSSDSDSDFEPANGSHFKKHLEEATPDLVKLKNIKCQPKKQVDVTNDVVRLVKNRISAQKQADRNRLVNKRKPVPDSSSDSDYVPEPIKKKHHDSEDEFLPKTKVKRRVQVRPELPARRTKNAKMGNDTWVEVFLEAEEKWISVDVAFGQVHCIKEIFQRVTHPVSYILAWNNNNNVKDVTQRYCVNFNTVTRKLRIDQKWWNESLKPFMGLPTARDKEEDDDLVRQQLDQPLPKVISEYKDHPLYALRRHLLKFEAIYPPEPVTLGFIRGEPVYSRSCIYTCHSRDIWLKQAKVVKLGEQPYKIVKARPKWDKLSNQLVTDQLLEIFGPWQVEDYEPPTAENGIVPRNAFGNVDLFKPSMLPKGCVHLKLPGLNKIAKRMNIDCASAIVGFDFHGGWSHPTYDGFVVCKEYEDQLICAWELEQDELERKEQEKIDKRVYGNWKKLIRGLLIRERLKAKYDFGQSSSSTSTDKKKSKGPTFCTKKK